MEKPKKNPNQVTGNAGLFYASYQLAVRGWNVLPTSRNSKGPDIFIYSQDGKKMYKIQVKSLSKLNHVNPGSMDSWLMNDFVIICTNVYTNPDVYIARPKQFTINKHGWINKDTYTRFKDNWKIIKS